VPGATVWVFGQSVFAFADDEGNFRLIDLPQGSYDLTMQVPGLSELTEVSADVTPGETTNLGVILACCPEC
jgi:hypothetical protein